MKVVLITLIRNPINLIGWGVCEEGFEGEVEEVQKKGNDPDTLWINSNTKPHYSKELVGFLKPAKPFDLRDYVVEYEDPRTKDYVVEYQGPGTKDYRAEYQGPKTKNYLEENRKILPHTAPGP